MANVTWHKMWIGVGSNLGNRAIYIKKAIESFKNENNIILKLSKIHETKPIGGVAQGDFLNAVFEAKTRESPLKVLEHLQKIEASLGRQRLIKWGPRTIDLDILFYDDYVIKTDVLTIPHPEIQNRKFVLAPFCEISKGFIHPVLGKRIEILLDELE